MNIIDVALDLAESGLVVNELSDTEVLLGRPKGCQGATFEGWNDEWNFATGLGTTFFKPNAPTGRIVKVSKKKWQVEIAQSGAPKSRCWLYEYTNTAEEAIALVIKLYFGNNETRKIIEI